MSEVTLASGEQQKAEPRYLIPEGTYRHDHPDVLYWTDHLTTEAHKRDVFANIERSIADGPCSNTANILAAAWYEFTCYVPCFLSKAVALTDDPERQHHLIQIAYDELGGKDKDYIHSKLFCEALETIDIEPPLSHTPNLIRVPLNMLDRALMRAESQAGIVGLLLSFEIIAEENIETLFKGLCYSEDYKSSLSDTPFFSIHRADEIEHIRHSVANFLRFCRTNTERANFRSSFDDGIDFWVRFWDHIARLINVQHYELAVAS